ncbi:hypothetical protein Pla108_16250 [Botrimarina colliarenosi]|uniref:Uncharacterized protein n=1 Tax=Botrimarina colliarenosi TaxID=2528001 RepID=A0A5C6AKX7_9BACT|nr:hypothetical protein [Botrimarina colliarenosi]TWU00673.1 hypothetical protein Pla108_16250 [Botrimarina colliarenosi]
MVATRKIRCVVVLADAETHGMTQRTQPRFRPSDLLPWADPHIRSLVEQLQQEVRDEEAVRREAVRPVNPMADEALTLDDEFAFELMTSRRF